MKMHFRETSDGSYPLIAKAGENQFDNNENFLYDDAKVHFQQDKRYFSLYSFYILYIYISG